VYKRQLPLGPGCVHRRPLHVVAEVARMGDRVVDTLGHLVHVEVRDRPVQRRGAERDCCYLGLRTGVPVNGCAWVPCGGGGVDY